LSSLRFPAPELEQLSTRLLASAPNEAGALVLAGYARKAGNMSLLVRETLPVPSDAYTIQTPYRLEIAPAFVAAALKRARLEGWAIVLVHTHPVADECRFSSADDRGEAILVPTLFLRAPERPHASLVLSRTSFDARTYGAPDVAPDRIDDLVEVGRSIIRRRRTPLADSVGAEFDRGVRAFGQAGQVALGQSTIAIVGLGGIGSIVAEQLGHALHSLGEGAPGAGVLVGFPVAEMNELAQHVGRLPMLLMDLPYLGGLGIGTDFVQGLLIGFGRGDFTSQK